MKFDELLFTHLGEMGRYQKIQFVLVCLPTIITAMHALAWTFAAVPVSHRCRLPQESSQSPFYADSPLLKQTNSCRLVEGQNRCDFEACSLYEKGVATPCKEGFRYLKDTENALSAIEKWDIICERGYIKATVQAAYYVGQMAGSLIFGVLGDKIGRKKVFFIAIVVQIICGLLESIVPHWTLYAVLRAGTGFSHPGIFVIAVVIGMELVGPKYRKLASVITGAFFAIGQVFLGIEAYFIRNYQILHLVIASPALFFLSYWWIVPESARWLVSKKRYQEADVVLQKAAKINKATLPNEWWDLLDTEEEKTTTTHAPKSSFFDLFRSSQLRRRTLAVFFLWPVVSMVYYGLAMNANVLGGDIYVNFIFGSLVEIPALAIVYLTIDRVGRRAVLGGGFLIAGLCLFSNLIVDEKSPAWMALTQFLITKGAITGTYAGIYTFSPELFPTVVRNSAMGACSMIARIGAISASYISMWLVARLGKIYMVLPFGALSVTAAFVTICLLPETMGRSLPETIEELEQPVKDERELQPLASKEPS